MKTVAIVGVGLIGGSFALALRKAGFDGEILGVSSRAAVEAGARAGAITRGATLTEAAGEADLLYLAQPVDRIVATLEELGPVLRSGCLVTDAGSTKARIVEAARCLPGNTFLGGHPMAGKEQRGVEAADADLFKQRPYVLTPTAPETESTREFRQWLERIGARVLEMRPDEHDATVALTSHLPQLVSTALAGTLSRAQNQAVTQVFGSGLLDMTRLALSKAELWESILSTNEGPVCAAIDAFMEYLGKLKNEIGSTGLASLFTESGAFAAKIRNVADTE